MGVEYPIDDRLCRAKEVFNLSKSQLRKLWTIFLKYDLDDSGSLDIGELLAMIDEPTTEFVRSIFHLVDIEKPEELEFSEFVYATCTYCAFSLADILKFCFYIFDRNKNAEIDTRELKLLIKILHQEGDSNANVESILASFDINNDGVLSFNEFEKLVKKYPQLLYPAFRLQFKLQRLTFGRRQWASKLSKLYKRRRNKEFGNASISFYVNSPISRALAVLKPNSLNSSLKYIHEAWLAMKRKSGSEISSIISSSKSFSGSEPSVHSEFTLNNSSTDGYDSDATIYEYDDGCPITSGHEYY